MKASDLNFLLICEFPELTEKYNDEISWQEGENTGSHVVYGDIFVPFFKQNIEANNIHKLIQIFNFIENLLLLNDDYASEVVVLTILYSISDSNINTLMKYAKYNTKKYFKILCSNLE